MSTMPPTTAARRLRRPRTLCAAAALLLAPAVALHEEAAMLLTANPDGALDDGGRSNMLSIHRKRNQRNGEVGTEEEDLDVDAGEELEEDQDRMLTARELGKKKKNKMVQKKSKQKEDDEKKSQGKDPLAGLTKQEKKEFAKLTTRQQEKLIGRDANRNGDAKDKDGSKKNAKILEDLTSMTKKEKKIQLEKMKHADEKKQKHGGWDGGWSPSSDDWWGKPGCVCVEYWGDDGWSPDGWWASGTAADGMKKKNGIAKGGSAASFAAGFASGGSGRERALGRRDDRWSGGKSGKSKARKRSKGSKRGKGSKSSSWSGSDDDWSSAWSGSDDDWSSSWSGSDDDWSSESSGWSGSDDWSSGWSGSDDHHGKCKRWKCKKEETYYPTFFPTISPTLTPTLSPTNYPTFTPSYTPTTESPSYMPTTESPSAGPHTPTTQPTRKPTRGPSRAPTRGPSAQPTTRGPSNPPTTPPTPPPTPETPTNPPTPPPTPPQTPPPTPQPTTRGPSSPPTTPPPIPPPTPPPTPPPAPPPTPETPTTSPTDSPTTYPPTRLPSKSPIEELRPCAVNETRFEPPEAESQLGWDVALALDFALVGAPGTSDTGAAFIIDLAEDGNSWVRGQELTPSSQELAKCGEGVAIAEYSGFYYAVVGCPDREVNGAKTGSVYIYKRGPTDDEFVLVRELIPENSPVEDDEGQFGFSVAINGQGYLVVGAAAAREGRGLAYLYEPSANDEWSLVETFRPAVTQGLFANFGWDVAISEDNTVVVGAPFNGEQSNGAFFVYKQEDDWQQFGNVTYPDTNSLFGFSVTIEDNIVVVGARTASEAFVYDISADGAVAIQTIDPGITSQAPTFGDSVSLKDGNLAIGRSGSTGDGNSVYIYRQNNDGTFGNPLGEQSQIVAPSNPADTDIGFGTAVAINEFDLFVGATLIQEDTGSLFVYLLEERENCTDALSPIEPDSMMQSLLETSVNPVSLQTPGKRYMAWSTLAEEDQEVARVYLGYTSETWNSPLNNELEDFIFDELYDDAQSGAISLGFGDEKWDCHVNHYFGWWWEEMEDIGLDHHLTTLGWDETTWDNDGPKPESEGMYWEGLSDEQQGAASQLCYFEELWNAEETIPEWDLR